MMPLQLSHHFLFANLISKLAMPKSTMSASLLLLFIVLVYFTSDANIRLANGQISGQKTWCVAKPSASDEELQKIIDFTCNEVEGCTLIQDNGPCYYPNSLINHASVVMNLYYQQNGRNYWNCNFSSSGLKVLTDPSYGDCTYVYI